MRDGGNGGKTRLQLAVHEAGHVIACEAVGAPWRKAHIDENGGMVDCDLTGLGRFERAVVFLCGQRAEARFAGAASAVAVGDDDAGCGLWHAADWKRLEAEVRYILDRGQVRLYALAEALAETGSVAPTSLEG